MRLSIKNILWVYAFLLIGMTYIFGLFVDLTGDSGLYAAISGQMVESGDWLNLKINGEPYDQKPHLLFWLAGFGIKIFGNTNFAFKIFPVFWGLAGLFFTYKLAVVLNSKKTGKLAVLIAGTSQVFVLYFLDIHTDTILQTGVMLALWQLTVYFKNNRLIHFIFGFLGIGLAMFTKGPVGAVVPFFAVLFFLLHKKRYRQIFQLKWIWGVLIILIVISPNLFHLYSNFGWEGIRFYFITNNFGRISGDYAGSSNDYFFYLHTVLWALLPWIIFALVAIFSEIKKQFSKQKRDSNSFFLVAGVLVYIFILSIAKGKAPNYFLLAVPVLSIVTAQWILEISNFSEKQRRQTIFAQQIVLAILFLLFVGIAFVFRKSFIVLPVILISLLIVITFLSNRIIPDKIERTVFHSVLILATLFFYLSAQVIPELYSYQGAKQVLQEFEKNKNQNDQLYNLHLEEYELFYYAKEPVIQIHTNAEYREMLQQENIWIYTTESGYKGILNNIGTADTVIYVKQKGMNRLSLSFLNPATRTDQLETNYLIKK